MSNENASKYPHVWIGPSSRTGETRSKIEADVAISLDVAGFNFVYEPKTFHGKGFDHYYTPDFYIPEQNIILEVGGDTTTDRENWDEHHVQQAKAFITLNNCRMNLGTTDPSRPWFFSVNSSGGIQDVRVDGTKVPWRESDIQIYQCFFCNRWFFGRQRLERCPFCEGTPKKLPSGRSGTKILTDLKKWWIDGGAS